MQKRSSVVSLPHDAALPRAASLEGGELRVVRAHWGEEKISFPNTYCTCTVGPFEVFDIVMPGEPLSAAEERVQSDLVRFSEAERKRKLKSFVAVLEELGISAGRGK